MIDLSFSEFRALTAKALRGVGYAWGLADDGAYAAKRLAEFGLPAADVVLVLLRAVDAQSLRQMAPNENWQPAGDMLCPICVGTSLADQANDADVSIGPMISPLLAAPLLLTSAGATGPGYIMRWDVGSCVVASTAMVNDGGVPMTPVEVTISRNSQPLPPSAHASRIVLSDDAVAELEAYAHRTYAPSTEASRAGAGSDTSDID